MIIGLFPGLASVGGVQIAGRQTAAALAAIANDRNSPCVFLSLNDASGEQDTSVGVHTIRFTGFARQKHRFLFRALSLALKKPKLILVGHPNLAPIAVAMKIAAKDARVIVGAHGIEVWQPLPLFRRSALRFADVVTAPSSDTVQRLASVQGVSKAKLRRLPWPLDPAFSDFVGRVYDLPRPAAFPTGQIVLSVGRWVSNERYKGADHLIDAIADLSHDFPDLHLVLVGSGDDLVRLKQQAQSSMIAGRIHFLENLSRQELAAWYATADIFALPSTGEGFGLVFLEAMAFGKPVVGTNFGGIPDVVENGRQGLLVEPIAAAISVALRRLLSDAPLREEMGKQGRERVNRDFTFAAFQRGLLSILDEVMESKNLRAG